MSIISVTSAFFEEI